MNCPECHTSMQEGYIPTGGGIHWFRAREDTDLFPTAEALPATSAWFRRAKLEAYRCPRCQLVTFRYGKQVEDVRDFRHR